MARVVVNNIDLNNVTFSSINLVKQASQQNSFSCIFTTDDFDYEIIAGQEIQFYDDDDILRFGGVLTQPTKKVMRDRVEYTLASDGYKQILKRRVLQNVFYREEMSGDIIRDVFDRYLKEGVANSENFIEGDIADGTFIDQTFFQATYIDDLFSELADVSGYRYWIDENRRLNFNATPTYVGIDRVLTDNLTAYPDTFTAEDYPTYKEDTARLKTRSYILGKKTGDTSPLGIAKNETLESELQGKVYGSGLFEKISTSPSIVSDEEAEVMAESEIKLFEVGSGELNFKCLEEVDVNNIFNVDLTNINLEAPFYAEKVSIQYAGILPIYTVLAKPFTVSKQFPSWTDEFKQMLNSSGDKADTFPKTLFYNNEADEVITTTSGYFAWNEPLYTGVASNIDVGFTLKGLALADGYMVIRLLVNTEEVEVFPKKVWLGEEFAYHINYPLQNLKSGTNFLEIQVDTLGPQLEFSAGAMQFWVTSIAFVTGARATVPVIDVIDALDLTGFNLSDSFITNLTAPLTPNLQDNISLDDFNFSDSVLLELDP